MPQTLYIIDGHAQIYAAYYAPMSANLTAPDGEPTRATYIFTTMLIKLLRECRPDYICVAMDAPGPTFRHEIYPNYKANRPAMPEDLPPQIARVHDILEAFNIPIISIPGFEADDIIGTLTRIIKEKGLQTCIVSRDKDLEQLLDENTFMYDPRKDATRTSETLLDDKGLRPDQFIDALALEGDTSDNIPGVPDVGPKTALSWIKKYGSLDNLIAHADEVKGKRGDNLRASIDQLKLSRQLVTINREIPLETDLQSLTVKDFDRDKVANLFTRLNFNRLLEQLDLPANPDDDANPADAAATSVVEYTLINTDDLFAGFLTELNSQSLFAVDTETTSCNAVAANLVGMSFSWTPGQAYYLPLKAPLGQQCLDRQKTLDALRPIMENPAIGKIGQNIKYDLIVFRKAGIHIQGIVSDTMIASYILDSSRTSHSLDFLAKEFLNHDTIKLSSLLGKGKNQLTFDMVDTATACDYAAEDADITLRLHHALNGQLTDVTLRHLYEDLELPLLEVLAEMEYNGVYLDTARLRKLSVHLSEKLDEIIDKVHAEAGQSFNLDSPRQLSQILFDKLGLKSVKKTKTGQSTDQEVLEALQWQHPIAGLLLEYRQLSKLKNTYVDKLPSLVNSETCRLHASFNQTVTATGRLSSSDPNLQNIPIRTEPGRQIRHAFAAQHENGLIFAADYSQIELRFLAHFSNDEALLNAFAAEEDIHRFVAAQVNGITTEEVTAQQRSKAKAVNFGIIYGQTAYGLSRAIGIDVAEAQSFIDDYFARYPHIRTWMDDILNEAKKRGYVATILGRRRSIPDLNSRNVNRRRMSERMAINTVVQGSAADMIKRAMLNIHRRIKAENLPLKMLLQVHDELVFELPSDHLDACSHIITSEMANAIPLSVPIIAEAGSGPNWLEAK